MSKTETNVLGIFFLIFVAGYILVSYLSLRAKEDWYKQQDAIEAARAERVIASGIDFTNSRMVGLSYKSPEAWDGMDKKDAWDHEIKMKVKDNMVYMISAGPNGTFGDWDDIIREFPLRGRK